jgi:hypothetical protein
MPTEPFSKILDPEGAIAGARPIIELASPLLREVANHASWAAHRCLVARDERPGIDEDLAPFTLYRQIIECTDSMEVLVRAACALGSIPVLRTGFEACLSLQYILKEDTSRRSLAWACLYAHRRLQVYRLYDPASQVAREYAEGWKEQFGEVLPPRDVSTEISNLEQFLALDHMRPVEEEYRSTKKRSEVPVQWFTLFGGPRDLKGLAAAVHRAAEYELLYRLWSSVAHAGDSLYLARTSKGKVAFKSIRYPVNLREVAVFGVLNQYWATEAMIGKYRPGEPLMHWYANELREPLRRLRDFKVQISEREA